MSEKTAAVRVKTKAGVVYEVLRNGKPMCGRAARMEAFLAFTPPVFRYVTVAMFPASFGKDLKGAVRAITFAVDKAYIDTVVDAVEKKWPKTVPKRRKVGRV